MWDGDGAAWIESACFRAKNYIIFVLLLRNKVSYSSFAARREKLKRKKKVCYRLGRPPFSPFSSSLCRARKMQRNGKDIAPHLCLAGAYRTK